jgi:hypothetical protein
MRIYFLTFSLSVRARPLVELPPLALIATEPRSSPYKVGSAHALFTRSNTNMRRPTRLAIDVLESRTTPAVTIVNATTATFTDVDGDLATVKVSKGTLTAGLFTTVASGSGDQLQTIDLSGGGFDGASLTISAKKAGSGDGLVNVGYINSTGHNLGAVSVAGDLGRIDAGSPGFLNVTAVKSLTLNSLGKLGLATQGGVGSLTSALDSLGRLAVAGAMVNADISVQAKFGSATIGGSMTGGSISSGGDIGRIRIVQDLNGGTIQGQNLTGVTIGGSLIGGATDYTGFISSFANGVIGFVRIGHNLQGGAGLNSGSIAGSGGVGRVQIGGDVVGAAGSQSGSIYGGSPGTGINLAGVTIVESLIGGTGSGSGSITTAGGTGDMGPIRIGKDLMGGSISGTTTDLLQSGAIESAGRIASITIGGSIISGTDTSTAGSLMENGSIRASDDIGSIRVTGNLIGNSNSNGDSPVIISARGQATQKAPNDVAIGSITIGGKVELAQILAGYTVSLAPTNADAQIGRVSVGGDWIASSLVAGVAQGADGLFGTSDDAKITGGTDNAAISSKIGSIRIGGQVQGTAATGDHFGFVAEQIGSFKVGTATTALKPGVNNDVVELLGSSTADVTIREVA